jgi:tetratricopeptide (TPR) repeat protein
LGDLLKQQGRYAEAIDQYAYTATQASDPNWLWQSHQRIGSVYAIQGLWPPAIDEYRQALAMRQSQGVADSVLAQNYASLGSIFQQACDLAEARSAYLAALELDPANSAAQRGLDSLGGG